MNEYDTRLLIAVTLLSANSDKPPTPEEIMEVWEDAGEVIKAIENDTTP